MIIKNEEQFLRRCLASVSSLTFEMIIVDTGCTDRSIEIARSFNARILKFEWQDDFSKARNFGIEQAGGEWILVLDGDEVLHPESIPKLLRACEIGNKNCFKLTQRHYGLNPSVQGFLPCHGEFLEMEQGVPGYFESSLVRLFPNDPKLRYRNRIHELVEPSIFEHPEFKLVNSDIRIHHYGSLKPKKNVIRKAKLYTELGELKASETPLDWKALYELGIEHNCNGRLQESARAFSEAAKLNPSYCNLWINYGYVLCELKEFQAATSALEKAINIDPSNSEAWSNLGVVYLRAGRYLAAAETFRIAVSLSPKYINAWRNLGDSLLNAALPVEACNAFEQALTLLPNDSGAKQGLGIAAFMMGNLARAEKLLRQTASSPRSHYWLKQLERLTGVA